MEETVGEQEDPAGVKMGRRIPFLRDKLQEEDWETDATLGRSQDYKT